MANLVHTLILYCSQDFKVLTVHKSTLRRGKKVEPCPVAEWDSRAGGNMKVELCPAAEWESRAGGNMKKPK